MAAFAERLRTLREARKMTQVRLAVLLEIDPCVYTRWERGTATPKLDTMVGIAQLLQVSLDELVGLEATHSAPAIHDLKMAALDQQVDTLSDEVQQALVVLRVQMSKVLAV